MRIDSGVELSLTWMLEFPKVSGRLISGSRFGGLQKQFFTHSFSYRAGNGSVKETNQVRVSQLLTLKNISHFVIYILSVIP